MSEITVFNYSDYREYIEAKIKSKEFGRGGKAKMAEHLGCQPSFVSQVLKGKSSFSLEQGFKLNSFFKHNKLMEEYFVVLIEWDRAGTYELQKYFEGKKNELLEKSKLVENQMDFDQLTEVDAMEYYSDWNAVLIRGLVDIPKYQKPEALKKKLKLSQGEWEKSLKFLLEKDLLQMDEKGHLKRGYARLHIKKGSPIAKFVNITNRLQMLKTFDQVHYDSFQYACNMTLAESKLQEFRGRLVKLVSDLNAEIAEDHEAETMASMVIDLVEI